MKLLLQLKKDGVPQSVKSAVNAYLLARALAEAEAERVGTIQREILATADYWSDPENTRRFGDKRIAIKNPKDAWLMQDSEFKSYLSDVRYELEKAGYKIKQAQDSHDYWNYFCPALTAESVQRDTENLLIKCGAEMIGIDKPEDFNNQLLCLFTNEKSGLEHRQYFIDLLCKLVVNMPGYKNPLTGKVGAA